MARFLVIGGSGLIGRRFLGRIGAAAARGTYHARPFTGGVKFDLAADRIEDVLDTLDENFTHALILGAVAAIDFCAREPTASGAINVRGTIRLIDGLVCQGIVPIFASTDGVYDGSQAMWREEDEVRPILTYGRQKRAVEEHILANCETGIVLRLAKVLDPDLDEQGVLGPWIKALIGGAAMRSAVDQRFSPVGVEDVVRAIRALADVSARGVFNLGGNQSLSRFDLLRLLAAAVSPFAAPAADIEPCSIRDFPFAEARPLDTSMSIDKLKSSIAFQPERLEELCRRAASRHFTPAQSALIS